MNEVSETVYSERWQVNIDQVTRDRFARKVDRRGPDECWPWKKCRTKFGYGHFRIGPGNVKSHRFAWVAQNGPIPKGMKICHKCDNTGCCNPGHLFLGTSLDNNQDRDRKGRGCTGDKHWSRLSPEKLKRGTSHPDARMTEEDVIRIRALHAAGTLNLSAEGRRIGVSHIAVRMVAIRRTWKHVP